MRVSRKYLKTKRSDLSVFPHEASFQDYQDRKRAWNEYLDRIEPPSDPADV
jgi:hypothetical protein